MTDNEKDVKKILNDIMKPVVPNQRLLENWVTACKLQSIIDMVEEKIAETATNS